MAIPSWISKAAEELDKGKDALVNFSDHTYDKLVELYKGGKLDETSSALVEEMEELRGVLNHAVAQASEQILSIKKEAAPAAPPKPKGKGEDAPFDFGDERLKEEMTPAPASPKGETPGKLPARIKQPETTKWKEIRFNKRTGTWQVVVTIRHTRNFSTENEAVEFTKKAEMSGDNIEKSSEK